MVKKSKSVLKKSNSFLFIALGVLVVFVVAAVVFKFGSFGKNLSGNAWAGSSGSFSPVLNQEVGPVKFQAGWNLIHGFVDSTGQLNGQRLSSSHIKAVYWFSPKSQEYVRLYPSLDVAKLDSLANMYGRSYVTDSLRDTSLWAYSDITQNSKYSLPESPFPVEDRELYAGWNFVSVTPDFDLSGSVGSGLVWSRQFSWADMAGGCDISKAYYFNTKKNDWVFLSNSDPIDYDDVLYKGFVLKVSSDCSLGRVLTGTIAPVPVIPGGTTPVNTTPVVNVTSPVNTTPVVNVTPPVNTTPIVGTGGYIINVTPSPFVGSASVYIDGVHTYSTSSGNITNYQNDPNFPPIAGTHNILVSFSH